jgi:hypothetical protein
LFASIQAERLRALALASSGTGIPLSCAIFAAKACWAALGSGVALPSAPWPSDRFGACRSRKPRQISADFV